MTLVPVLIAVTLLIGLAPFVGAFAFLVSLVALLLWVLWRIGANVVHLTGGSVFRRAEMSELFGRGGPDDPDLMLVPRPRQSHPQRRTVSEAQDTGASPLD